MRLKQIKVLYMSVGVLIFRFPDSSSLFYVFVESAVGKLAEEVQEQQRLAEAVGGLHQLQPVLLQVPPGERREPPSLFVQPTRCSLPRPVYPPLGFRTSHVCVECEIFVPY